MEYIDPTSLARIDANSSAEAGEAIQMANDAVGGLATLGDGLGELVATCRPKLSNAPATATQTTYLQSSPPGDPATA